MLDPKFKNLPFLAKDEKDVYETDDMVSNEPEYYEEEPENDSIDRSQLNPTDAFSHFKQKYLIGNVDFSDNIAKKRNIGYNAVSSIYEIVGDGEKESPFQKCQRLQCEMNELMEEITTLENDKTVSKEEQEAYYRMSKVVQNSKKILDSLHLEEALGDQNGQSTEKAVRNLLTNVESYKKGAPETAAELIKLKNQSDITLTTRIAEIEHKLHKIEQTVGMKSEKISRLNSSLDTKNLLEAVQQLSTKSALLQPNQLDVIEQRLTNLSSKMDQFKEKANAANTDRDREQKISELYEFAKSTEPIAKVLPDMLERMKTLEALHSYAANFSKLFAELEATQNIILKGISSNKELLQSVQKAFVENDENAQKEFKKLEDRVIALTGKK
ncbi:dynactin subunit 2 [Chironomus tepperi]|uniref:dynactin subunit 2 n=1 Tax=Chironomus tepperi TaxID=113505 RepID=UPI00391F4F94